MRLSLLIMLCTFLLQNSSAQVHYEYSGKNELAKALTEILNASNHQFAKCKGGKATQYSLPGADAYKCRLRLPDIKEGYLIQPKDSGSKPFLRYVLHRAGNRADAEAAYLKDVQTLIGTYKKKWMVYRDPVSDNGIESGTKTQLCYQQPNGFVYSSARVVARQQADSNWAILLEVDAGPAGFYYFTPRNPPVISDLFVEGFRKNFEKRGDYELQCVNNMPGFNCRVLTDSSGAQKLEYFKWFSSLFEAQFEYDVALTNVRAALGAQYLHRRSVAKNGCGEAVFVHTNQVARNPSAEAVVAVNCREPQRYELVISLPKKTN